MNTGNSSLTGNGGSALKERLFSVYQRYQYAPWMIKITTLDRRLVAAIAALPLLFILMVLILAITLSISETIPCGSEYRGTLSKTESGLRCQKWSKLDRNVHTVTTDRYPGGGLGDHNHCRNPDDSLRPWCYTNLQSNYFDYCDVDCSKAAENISQLPSAASLRDLGNSTNVDLACPAELTVINTIRADGQYQMTGEWENGRGVYRRRGQEGLWCLWWHGLYRHWWLGPCKLMGRNVGVGWLEEDARCPQEGKVWRAGGTDKVMPRAKIVKKECMEYETGYSGDLLDDRIQWNGQIITPTTESPSECQDVCFQVSGCNAFSWYKDSNCTLWKSVNSRIKGLSKSVSGGFTCEQKVKVGCPPGSELVGDSLCFLYLEQACNEGCSRYAAMQKCEELGGFLADSLSEEDLNSVITLTKEKYSHSFWWLGASDFSKRDGKFSWEGRGNGEGENGDIMVASEVLWVNSSTIDSVGSKKGGSEQHQCVYLAPNLKEQVLDVRLDHQNCQATVARPICQFITK